MISAPTFATRIDQMICWSQRRWIRLPFTGMCLGGTNSCVVAVIVPSPGAVEYSDLMVCQATSTQIARFKAKHAGMITSIQCRQGDTELTSRANPPRSVSYTHLRAHETRHDLVCRL